MSAGEVFEAYLERFTSGDSDGAAELLTDDFTFAGPILQAKNKADFLAGAAGLGRVVQGYEMLRQWVDDDEVCSIYDFKVGTSSGTGSIPMAEWSVVRDGKLASSRLVFDTAAMAALLPTS